ncbi:uncharacterized protein LOC118456988 isoform X1 [Anopheles albimanus]|uniref:uncharacterized protein LOC118456988 isoform X1 n=1 Tax=Anopheles albimanus TaxID=7167 RepID=UPI001640E9A3|nr:uncharacterized protein LOC118456988 isoform X1 [Anopheles albimanus]
MCSTVTYKLLCCFYGLCNMYFAYFACQRAEGVSQMIVRDGCCAQSNSSELQTTEDDGSCNVITYVGLIGAGVLDCAMSLLMMAAVLLVSIRSCGRKPSAHQSVISIRSTKQSRFRSSFFQNWSKTIWLYMAYLWIRYLFCLGLWLVIWKAFGSSEQMPYMPFSVWCLVLLLFSVYYSLELWIMKGTYDAINLECGIREQNDAACCPSLGAGGFMA